jgi:N-acetyl-gamma-glutamyl-phosphate reductase
VTHSVFIDGAAGTTGLEIRERLAGRSEFALVALDDAPAQGPGGAARGAQRSDFAVPVPADDAAREAVALIDPGSRVRVIDASTRTG